ARARRAGRRGLRRALHTVAPGLRPDAPALRGRFRAPTLACSRHLERTIAMPEADEHGEKSFFPEIPASAEAFFVKGAGAYDWGMQNRLARIFRAGSGRTVMLAFDHGYFQGPTSGLERLDLNIVPLAPHTDALMLTRGALRTTIPPRYTGGIVMRASGGPSILKDLSNERI